MELRNSESSERYVHVTQSLHERHVRRICVIGDESRRRQDATSVANSES